MKKNLPAKAGQSRKDLSQREPLRRGAFARKFKVEHYDLRIHPRYLREVFSFAYCMVLLIIIITLFILYSLLIIYYWLAWQSIPEYKASSSTPGKKISVIIPARNEEKNIAALIESLQKQTYPAALFEVIIVDDNSSDQTAAIIRQYPSIKLIQLKEEGINSYKKKAIETGIAATSGEIMVATDADCTFSPEWLRTIADFYITNNAVFVAAPVSINSNSSVLQTFQAMDFMILQAITGAAVSKKILSMCNGANIAYSKKVFSEVNGFSGIDSIASGDDMLLMYKIAQQHPANIFYLKSKEAVVNTAPQTSWSAFFNQRIRWASKANHYNDKRFFPVLLLVYLFNLSFLVLAVAGFFCNQYWLYLAALWVAKTLIEFPLFWSAATFFNKKWALKLFFFFQPLHIIYTIISGLFGQFGKYEWKGRRVK